MSRQKFDKQPGNVRQNPYSIPSEEYAIMWVRKAQSLATNSYLERIDAWAQACLFFQKAGLFNQLDDACIEIADIIANMTNHDLGIKLNGLDSKMYLPWLEKAAERQFSSRQYAQSARYYDKLRALCPGTDNRARQQRIIYSQSVITCLEKYDNKTTAQLEKLAYHCEHLGNELKILGEFDRAIFYFRESGYKYRQLNREQFGRETLKSAAMLCRNLDKQADELDILMYLADWDYERSPDNLQTAEISSQVSKLLHIQNPQANAVKVFEYSLRAASVFKDHQNFGSAVAEYWVCALHTNDPKARREFYHEIIHNTLQYTSVSTNLCKTIVDQITPLAREEQIYILENMSELLTRIDQQEQQLYVLLTLAARLDSMQNAKAYTIFSKAASLAQRMNQLDLSGSTFIDAALSAAKSEPNLVIAKHKYRDALGKALVVLNRIRPQPYGEIAYTYELLAMRFSNDLMEKRHNYHLASLNYYKNGNIEKALETMRVVVQLAFRLNLPREHIERFNNELRRLEEDALALAADEALYASTPPPTFYVQDFNGYTR